MGYRLVSLELYSSDTEIQLVDDKAQEVYFRIAAATCIDKH